MDIHGKEYTSVKDRILSQDRSATVSCRKGESVVEFLILLLTFLAPALAVVDDILRILLESKKRQQRKDNGNEDSEKPKDE
jgi:hypothetical protein